MNHYRRRLVAWDHNPPDPFPGFGGMVGLGQDAAQAANGDWLVAFHAGYWHISMATPLAVAQTTLENWRQSGMPTIDAPRGGRVMAIRSADQGRTWSKPQTLFDGRWSDAPIGLTQLDSGRLLLFINQQASWYGLDKAPPNHLPVNTRIGVIHSDDNGHTWSPPRWLEAPYPFYQRAHAHARPLPDGSILFPTYCNDGKGHLHGAIHRSTDNGTTWQVHSTLERSDGKDLDEPSLTLLADGRLMLLSRLDAALFYSEDQGKSWKFSHRAPFAPLKAHRTTVLADGTVLFWGTSHGTLRVSWSTDNGLNWKTTPDGKALPLDPDCYGYPGGFLLPDQSVFAVYYDATHRQQRTAVWGLRFKLDPVHQHIELVPLPGQPTRDDSTARSTEELDADA